MKSLSADEFLQGGDFQVMSPDDFLAGGGFTIEGEKKEEPKKNTLQRVGEGVADIVGIGGVAKAVGGAASVLEQSLTEKAVVNAGNMANTLIKQARKLPIGSPERKRILQQVLQITGNTQTRAQSSMQDLAQAPTASQAVGSVAKVAVNAATFGSGGVAANVAGRALEGGLIGAAFQATQNLEQGKPVSDNLGTASLIGGAIPLAGTALSKSKQLLGVRVHDIVD
jgi:hypothetical protein